MTSTIINLFCFWLLKIPVALLASFHFCIVEKRVFIAVLLVESLLGVVEIIMFQAGKWKTKKV